MLQVAFIKGIYSVQSFSGAHGAEREKHYIMQNTICREEGTLSCMHQVGSQPPYRSCLGNQDELRLQQIGDAMRQDKIHNSGESAPNDAPISWKSFESLKLWKYEQAVLVLI